MSDRNLTLPHPLVRIVVEDAGGAPRALLVHYAHVSVPIINTSRVFDVLAIAYVALMVGVLFRGV